MQPTITLFLTLSYLMMMMFPVIMILNDSVKANKAVDEGVLHKLELLDLNIDLLESQSVDADEKAKLNEFKGAIKEVTGLIGKYTTPVYKFMWIFRITRELRNQIVGTITTTFTGIALGFLINV